jgi:hypothetical protein
MFSYLRIGHYRCVFEPSSGLPDWNLVYAVATSFSIDTNSRPSVGGPAQAEPAPQYRENWVVSRKSG